MVKNYIRLIIWVSGIGSLGEFGNEIPGCEDSRLRGNDGESMSGLPNKIIAGGIISCSE